MKTILVPTDFSNASGNAAEYAIYLAKALDAKVILFHVYNIPIPLSPEVPAMLVTTDELQRESDVQLKMEAERLRIKTGRDVDCLAKMGLIVDEIIEEGCSADFIIMGMQSAGAITEVLLGSTTTATLRRSTVPVLVIPENAKYKAPGNIVFACDYDPNTNLRSLDALKVLIRTFGSKIFIVNIKLQHDRPTLKEAVAGIKVEGKLNDVEHTYFFPEKEDLVDGINEFVEEQEADMVAIVPHHYNVIERLFHSSVSKKIAFHTRVPLLALPDNKETDEMIRI